MTPMQQLITLLQLQSIGEDRYQGQALDLGLKQTFGGLLLGQAVNAAYQTLPESRDLHHLSSEFIRPGDSAAPVTYHVSRLRDGKSFSLRQVCAIQHDTPIFYLTASFQNKEHGLDTQPTIPDVPNYDTLTADHLTLQPYLTKLPSNMAKLMAQPQPFEVRTHRYSPPFLTLNTDPERVLWFKSQDHLTCSSTITHALMAFFSDFHLLPTALQPHGLNFLMPTIQTATLNHTMWFHRPTSLNDWHLFHIQAVNTANSRTLAKGEIFSAQGHLIATCLQEGLIRTTIAPSA